MLKCLQYLMLVTQKCKIYIQGQTIIIIITIINIKKCTESFPRGKAVGAWPFELRLTKGQIYNLYMPSFSGPCQAVLWRTLPSLLLLLLVVVVVVVVAATAVVVSSPLSSPTLLFILDKKIGHFQRETEIKSIFFNLFIFAISCFASMQMRYALFWDVTQRIGDLLTLEVGTDRLSRNVGTALLVQWSEDIIYICYGTASLRDVIE